MTSASLASVVHRSETVINLAMIDLISRRLTRETRVAGASAR
ncbi:hypothetical protein [Streptomyces sp. NPDC050355]